MTESAQDKKPIDVLEMYPAVGRIENAKIRQGVIEVWEELWAMSLWTDVAEVPTSGEIDYPNLPHTQCIVDIVLSVADAFERHHGKTVNRDLLIAAAVLQDASKVVEYEPTTTEAGRHHSAIGKHYLHGFWCAHLCVQKGLPHEISHIILTHGSVAHKFPDSLEGKILYYVDQLDVIAIHGDRWVKNLMISK